MQNVNVYILVSIIPFIVRIFNLQPVQDDKILSSSVDKNPGKKAVKNKKTDIESVCRAW